MARHPERWTGERMGVVSLGTKSDQQVFDARVSRLRIALNFYNPLTDHIFLDLY